MTTFMSSYSARNSPNRPNRRNPLPRSMTRDPEFSFARDRDSSGHRLSPKAVMVQVSLAPEEDGPYGLISTAIKDNGMTVAELTRHVVEVVGGSGWLWRICCSTADSPESGVKAVCVNYGDGCQTTVRVGEEQYEHEEMRTLNMGLSVTPEGETMIDHSTTAVLDPTMLVWDVVSQAIQLSGTVDFHFWVRWDGLVPFSYMGHRHGDQDSQGRDVDSEALMTHLNDGAGNPMVQLRYLSGAPVQRKRSTATATARHNPNTAHVSQYDKRKPPAKKRRARKKASKEDEKVVNEWGFTLDEEQLMMKIFYDKFVSTERLNPWRFTRAEEQVMIKVFNAEMTPLEGTAIIPMPPEEPESPEVAPALPKTTQMRSESASTAAKSSSNAQGKSSKAKKSESSRAELPQEEPKKRKSQPAKRKAANSEQETPRKKSLSAKVSSSPEEETPKKKKRSTKKASANSEQETPKKKSSVAKASASQEETPKKKSGSAKKLPDSPQKGGPKKNSSQAKKGPKSASNNSTSVGTFPKQNRQNRPRLNIFEFTDEESFALFDAYCKTQKVKPQEIEY